jgi:hypothetical protein
MNPKLRKVELVDIANPKLASGVRGYTGYSGISNDKRACIQGRSGLRVVGNLEMDYGDVFPPGGDGEAAVAHDLFGDGAGGGFGEDGAQVRELAGLSIDQV